MVALAALLRAGHEPDGVPDDHASETGIILLVKLPRLLAGHSDERHDARIGVNVDVLVADDLETLADPRAGALRSVDHLARDVHRLALHPAPDVLLHRRDALVWIKLVARSVRQFLLLVALGLGHRSLPTVVTGDCALAD